RVPRGGRGAGRRAHDGRGEEGARLVQRAPVPGAEGKGVDRGGSQAGAEGPRRGEAVRPRSPVRDQDRVPHPVAARRVPQPQRDGADRRAHARLPRGRLVDGVVAVLLLGFFGVSALVIVTPGQDTALTIRNTLRGGRRGGVLTALGVGTGQCGWALATSAGLATLLVASEPVFRALRWF